MGRHSGAVCKACQELILVRDGRLVEHQQQFPTLGTSLTCVGSHSTVRIDAAALRSPQGDVDTDLRPRHFVSRTQATTSP